MTIIAMGKAEKMNMTIVTSTENHEENSMTSLYNSTLIQPHLLEPQHISAPFITAITCPVRESPHFASSFLVSARPGRNFSYLGGISGE